MASVRTFIAFDTPIQIRDEMTALQNELRTTGVDVRWEPSSKFHATIKFLGGVDQSLLPAVTEQVRSVCEKSAPFSVRYQGLGAFPDRRHPRVIWIGCENDDGSLLKLKSALDAALLSYGFPTEERTYRPHITLGRVRTPAGLHYLTPKLEKLTFDPRAGTISEVLVMKSVLSPRGAEYTVLTSIHLHS